MEGGGWQRNKSGSWQMAVAQTGFHWGILDHYANQWARAGWMVEQEMRLPKASSKKKGPQILTNRVIYNQ